MSSTGKKNIARPDANIQGEAAFVFRYCDGGGDAACLTPLFATSTVQFWTVPKQIASNRRLLIHNPAFSGIQFFADAGAAGLCDHSAGAEKPGYLALSADGDLTNDEIIAQNHVLEGAPPYDIEFLARDIPQPTDPNWENRIYYHIYWGDETYLNVSSFEGSTAGFELELAKHDYDIQP